ncbi:MAG TPA: hypothetical protein VM118_13915 [Acidobacteriota bacterium]|nr:hypothetical protein [Acidobacteriota bacterium]
MTQVETDLQRDAQPLAREIEFPIYGDCAADRSGENNLGVLQNNPRQLD